ncbi:FMN-dependent NADH-azoreductase [Kiloniella laminariae]|uniref:FMN dependent NADH:quinone oxidoreductase n=1 Tax=Kiloniella laminariae TaxID=454162 RepID=A0ABT4LIH3_9PROT|nr:FMN-dependent NADH-azoreductase [Kiloniella laminariae]MCZ4280901.1 FMN-dependent NADH-azoreductase [Kiloniella laminariae]
MSNTLLVINSSPLGQGSKSRQLTASFASKWQDKNPQGKIIERDLISTGLSHLDEATIGAFFTPEDQRSPQQKELVTLSDALVAELFEADTIVLGVAMHNFSIPSLLKSYIDQIARAGKTFSYTENGPKGLLQDKTAYVLSATGGDYREGSPARAMNFIDPYLTTVLGFLGITDVHFIAAANAAKGDEGLIAAQSDLREAIAA